MILLLLAWPLAAWGAARALVVHEELPHAGALVILGGSRSYLERGAAAARLFRQGRAPRILLTNDGQRGGWASREQRNPFFVERSAAVLRRYGVPAGRIAILPPVVSSTHDEAVLLRRYADTHRLPSLLIVTSAYHSRRALWTFRRAFAGSETRIGIHPAPPSPPAGEWWLHRGGWRWIFVEYVKMAYYGIRYGV